LQDVQWAVGNCRGARKLARTPHVNQKKKKKKSYNLNLHRGLWPSGPGSVSLSLHLGFKPQRVCLSHPRCLTCLLGLQGIQWVRGLVVVCVSWPGHPGLSKNK